MEEVIILWNVVVLIDSTTYNVYDMLNSVAYNQPLFTEIHAVVFPILAVPAHDSGGGIRKLRWCG